MIFITTICKKTQIYTRYQCKVRPGMDQAPQTCPHMLYLAFVATYFRYMGVTLNLTIKRGLPATDRCAPAGQRRSRRCPCSQAHQLPVRTHWRLMLSIAVPLCARLLSLSRYVSVRQSVFSGMAEPDASPYLMSERCLMGAEYNEFRIRMAENCD